MFGRLYLGELRKQTSKSAIITLVIIMAVLLLLTAVLFDAVNDMIEEALQGDEATFESVYTEESAKQLLEYYRGELDKAVAAKEEAGFDYYRNYDSVYMYESYVAFMEYVIDNELYGVEIASVSNGVLNAGAGVTAETFTTTVGSMLILLVVIYAAIVAGGTFADEYKRGTVKMLLIRPVSRTMSRNTPLRRYPTQRRLIVIPAPPPEDAGSREQPAESNTNVPLPIRKRSPPESFCSTKPKGTSRKMFRSGLGNEKEPYSVCNIHSRSSRLRPTSSILAHWYATLEYTYLSSSTVPPLSSTAFICGAA